MLALKLLPLVFAACVTVSPIGKVVTQTPKVADFHAVDIGSGIQATVTRGPPSVKIEADEAVLPYIETRVDSSGVLSVRIEKNGIGFMRTGRIVAAITSPTLDGVEASGGSTVQAQMTPATNCAVAASGGSELTLTSLACEQLGIAVSGGSTLNAVGAAKKIEISASGGSTVRVRQIEASVVSIDASGASEIHAFASAELTAELSGGTELYVAGQPKVRSIEASGGAQIVDIR